MLLLPRSLLVVRGGLFRSILHTGLCSFQSAFWQSFPLYLAKLNLLSVELCSIGREQTCICSAWHFAVSDGTIDTYAAPARLLQPGLLQQCGTANALFTLSTASNALTKFSNIVGSHVTRPHSIQDPSQQQGPTTFSKDLQTMQHSPRATWGYDTLPL
jgi:hypothetical protein